MTRHDRMIVRLLFLCCAAMLLCSLLWALPSGVEDDLMMKEYKRYEQWKKEQLVYVDKNHLKILMREMLMELGSENKTNGVDLGKLFTAFRDVPDDNHDIKVTFASKSNEKDDRLKVKEQGHEIKLSEESYKDEIKPSINENDDDGGILKENNKPALQDIKPEVSYPPFVEYSPEDGPGEYGKGFAPDLNATEKRKMEKREKINHFNVYISDLISVHRRIPDSRPQECRNIQYRSDLPRASVVICFHNEAWSVLLRTVHSVLDRSPPHLLHEIILVDDFSERDHLLAPLDQYMSQLSKVRIIRSAERGGLTRARLIGYKAATAPVLVYLDSHIECYPGWLEPLLDRIATDPKTVPFPQVPQIKATDFSTAPSVFSIVGFFHWTNLEFDWMYIPESVKKMRKTEAEPVRSATMPGGLFAIDRAFFTHLGAYDPDLLYWGGENMELSFKIWMCNGSIEHHPCSQVGHIFRSQTPIAWMNPDATIFRNSMRVAEVWMDEYKHMFYNASFPRADFGDVSARKRLRESLNCHDFKWYLDNIYPFPVPERALAVGEIRNAAKPMCLDSSLRTMATNVIGCHGKGTNQWWQVKDGGKIVHDMFNLCYEGGAFKLQMTCADNRRPYWIHHVQNGTLVHGPTNLCVQMSVEFKLIMSRCTGSSWQQWILPSISS